MKIIFYWNDGTTTTDTNLDEVFVYLDGLKPTNAFVVLEKRNKQGHREWPHTYKKPTYVKVIKDDDNENIT